MLDRQQMRNKFDLKYKEHLSRKIKDLKKEMNALIVAHYYQREEVQELADLTGDSYALACEVTKASQDLVVFCGVKFMAESAAMLSPDKTILLPVEEAGCPLADMATVEKLRKEKEEYPEAAVVCYVNSTASIKAESDICCTSSNAIEIVRSLKQEKVIFLPDRNLGRYVQEHVPEKDVIIWPGYCVVHQRLTAEQVNSAKKLHPDAEFVAHPECRKEVLDISDYVGSTGGMIKYIKNSEKDQFLIGTEKGVVHKMKKDSPEKSFYLPIDQFICANMKLTTLGWLARSLEKKVHRIEVPEDIASKARLTLQRMLEVTGRSKKKG